jgi:hypothetical protein
MPLTLYRRESHRLRIVQEAGSAPGSVWTGAKNLVPNGIRSLDRPGRSETLYLLTYCKQVVIGPDCVASNGNELERTWKGSVVA